MSEKEAPGPRSMGRCGGRKGIDSWPCLGECLERLYTRYHQRDYVYPDPLVFLYDYPDREDREVVGLVAALLAYGRVDRILVSVSEVLERMGEPRAFLRSSPATLEKAFAGFRHRFTSGAEMGALLKGVKGVRERYGSLERCFVRGMRPADAGVIPALERFVETLMEHAGRPLPFLLPLPSKGSACKRLHLYLRWMVRRDAVDPGGWTSVSPAKLVVPLDTHMHRMARLMGMTRRRRPDGRAALEVTRAFRRLVPTDPVRYDFVLTRLGIHPDLDPADFLARAGPAGGGPRKGGGER